MSNKISIEDARLIMGDNIIGPEELKKVRFLKRMDNGDIPRILFPADTLEEKKKDYLLVLGIDKLTDGRSVTIRNLQSILGKDPAQMEPCFYNQDWYDKEAFIDIPIINGWFLIKKSIYEDSRAVQPTELMKNYIFPSAVSCAYTFFVAWLSLGIKLWCHDFVWCSDIDHNGDRVYVGKYHDIDGINKNGFSIHRHLALRMYHGCID